MNWKVSESFWSNAHTNVLQAGRLEVRLCESQLIKRPGVSAGLCHRVCFLTKPSLLVSLHFDSEAKVCQLDGSSLHLTGQQQVLRLRRTHVEAECGTGDEDSKRRIVTGTLL